MKSQAGTPFRLKKLGFSMYRTGENAGICPKRIPAKKKEKNIYAVIEKKGFSLYNKINT